MISQRERALVVALVLAVAAPTLADSPEPKGVRPVVTEQRAEIEESTGDVSLEWSGGTPPFAIVRADDDCFANAKHVWLLAEGVEDRAYVDPFAYLDGVRYHYKVYDAHAAPEVLGISPDGGLPGDKIVVRGAAFSPDCSENGVHVAGKEAQVVECSFMRLVFLVPSDSVTGHVIVTSPRGTALLGEGCSELFSNRSFSWK